MTAIGLEKVGRRFTDKEMVYLPGLRELESVFLFGTSVTDEGIARLEGAPNLQHVTLPDRCTAKSLTTLLTLPRLRILSVHELELTPASLDEINRMTTLETLVLPFEKGLGEDCLMRLTNLRNLQSLALPANLTDRGIGHLRQFPKLILLDLRRCTQVTDAGLSHLDGLREVSILTLPPATTDVAIKYLSGMKGLKNLDLRFTKVGDDGLKTVGELSSLRYVSLPPAATNTGVGHLHSLHGLRQLAYCRTGPVTREALARLKTVITKCDAIEYVAP
jgi:hypothetical protein